MSLTVIAGVLLVGALWWAQLILIPLVLGALIAYALDPIERGLVRWRVPHTIAAAFIVTAVLVGLAETGIGLRGQARAFVAELPAFSQKVRTLIQEGFASDGAVSAVSQVQQAAAELRRAADGAGTSTVPRGVTRVQVEEPGFRITDFLWRGSLGAIELTGQATIVLFLVFYLLASGDLYKRKVAHIAGPTLARRRVSVEILNQVTEQIERFLVARIAISLFVGVATALAFWALGVAQPAMWGIAAGVLNTVPYVGPCAVAAAAAVAGLMQFGSAQMAAVLAAVSVAVATIEGVLLTPWLMGRASRMNAGAVFVALSFWGWIWGVWGLLLAVPIMMVIKTVCEHVDGWQAVSELLGE